MRLLRGIVFVLGALAVLAAANLFGLVVTEGPPFVISRIAAGGAVRGTTGIVVSSGREVWSSSVEWLESSACAPQVDTNKNADTSAPRRWGRELTL
jgi:predicted short-subunit dehydrogenase-like oxidoreductase (DUF2520 family)